ncbi:MAG: nickel-dependent lactate racemase [Anaerolineales bacterium]
MTEFSLPFGATTIAFHLPDTLNIDYLEPEPWQPLDDPTLSIKEVLISPIGSQNWSQFHSDQSVGIAINDKTRPIPKPNPIPYLLESLKELGFQKDQITLFIGSGTHKPIKPSELSNILVREIIDNYHVVIHDCDKSPMVNLGTTSYQTPIQINAEYYKCDVKIAVSNIEPHHFMGFSGGVKTAAIGLASRKTITTNHAMLSHPKAKSGVYHLNPMRRDVEEIGKACHIDFSLGTILNEDKRILRIFFGEPGSVMKAAIPVVRQIFGVQVPKLYDLVIASPGGYPKDINLYQAEKGLTHAARITRKGGWVILLAACPEGSGSQSYEDYMKKAKSHKKILQHFKDGFFDIGPHKAFQIASEAIRVNIILVSQIDPKIIKGWMLTPSTPHLLQPLLYWVIDQLPANPRIAILPAATRTMTEVKIVR